MINLLLLKNLIKYQALFPEYNHLHKSSVILIRFRDSIYDWSRTIGRFGTILKQRDSNKSLLISKVSSDQDEDK